jgi:molecular chaperone GrpE
VTERKDNPVSDTPAENGETVAAPVSDTAEEKVSVSDTSARGNRGASPASDTEALRNERDEYLDALQRLKAEFDNFRKRTAREHEAMSARANEALLRELLPIIDDLERALEAAEQHEEAKLEDGVRLVHRALADVARRHGLEEIETGGAFDPHVHEALLAQPAEDAESGSVLQVLQKGYRLGDRVLRPARVVVAE